MESISLKSEEVRKTLFNSPQYLMKKFEIRTLRSTKKKPTQLSGFLFIQKLFSSLLFHRRKYKKEVDSLFLLYRDLINQ